jgi:hypothetical protein
MSKLPKPKQVVKLPLGEGRSVSLEVHEEADIVAAGAVIVTMRVADCSGPSVVEGSVETEKCSVCGELVRLAPSSLRLIAQGLTTILCAHCVQHVKEAGGES